MTKQIVSNLTFRIQLKAGGGSEKIQLIGGPTKTDSIVYQRHLEWAKNMSSAVESMINACPQESVEERPETSAADEIRKFKALLDDGIITQEEFDVKKKQLLGI